VAQHFSANLTTQLRQFLERWGWNFSEQGGIFPPVRQEILPVLDLGQYAGFGSSLVQPIYSIRAVGVAVAAIFPVAEILCGANPLTILAAWTTGAAGNARLGLQTATAITANLAAVIPAGLVRGGAITTTGAVGTTTLARPVSFVDTQGGVVGGGARDWLNGFEMQNGERLILWGGNANSNAELNVIFQENDPTV